MSGTSIGGQLAAITNKQRYGNDYYYTIGRMGGLKSRGGGFAKNPELAREAGRKGGQRSRRLKADSTHCINGHPKTPENIYVLGDNKYCRVCRSQANAAWRNKNKMPRKEKLKETSIFRGRFDNTTKKS